MLNEQFLPYAFIWAGFVFKCLDEDISRLTNGCIEAHFGYRKKTIIKSCLPVNYINKTIDLAIGQPQISGLFSIASDNESDLSICEVDTEPEANMHEAQDIWSKKKLLNVKKARKKTAGHYQKPKSTLKGVSAKRRKIDESKPGTHNAILEQSPILTPASTQQICLERIDFKELDLSFFKKSITAHQNDLIEILRGNISS